MALIALVYKRAGGSAFGLAKIMSFTIIPSFLVSPFAGAYVDRWNNKYTMIVTDIIRAVLVLIIPFFLIKGDSFLPIYGVVFLVFSVSCFFLPSKFSIIPELVSKEKLLIANSLTNTTIMVAALFGIGLGGHLIEKVGVEFGFYIDAATYIISAVLVCCINLSNGLNKKNNNHDFAPLRATGKSILLDIKDGISYVFTNPYLRFVFSIIFILMSAAGALYIMAIVFIQQVFGTVTKDIGFLSVFIGIGFFCGAIIFGRFGSKVSKVIIIFLCLIASGVLIFSFVVFLKIYPSLFIASILSFCIGVFVGPIFISGNTLIHEVIKAQMRGRIFSSLGIVMNLGFLIFMFAASKISEYFMPFEVILVIAGCLFFYGIFGIIRFRGRL